MRQERKVIWILDKDCEDIIHDKSGLKRYLDSKGTLEHNCLCYFCTNSGNRIVVSQKNTRKT